MTKPFLSLAMIVKNEEKNIVKLLDSVLLNRRVNGDTNIDELVLVDTGSMDETREMVTNYLGDFDPQQYHILRTWVDKETVDVSISMDGNGEHLMRVKLAHFDWVDDFAKARQFSFDLCTGEWVMFLDGDDELVGAKQLKNAILQAAAHDPRVNIMVMPYDYAAGAVKQPDVPRIFHWSTGDLSWRRPLHETVKSKTGKRFLGKPSLGPSGEPAYKVIHHKDMSGEVNSFGRNARIAAKVYYDPETPPDEKAEFAYFLAQSLRFDPECKQKVQDLLNECWTQFRGLNFGVYCAFDAARICVANKDFNLALDWASRIEGASPEFREGQLLLGWIHEQMGENVRACTHFDTAFARGPIALSSYDEIGFTQGEALISAARAYLAVNRIDDMGKCLTAIPPVVGHRREFRARIAQLSAVANQKVGLQKLMELVDFYLWDTQPQEALWLLDMAPAAIATCPEVAAKRVQIEAKTTHLESWEQYKKVYGTIPDEKYHTAAHHKEGVLSASRVEYLMQCLEDRPSDVAIRMCAIGFQDGIIEEEVLTRFQQVILTVADVAPQASKALVRLSEKFPGRVFSHAIVKDHYDWAATFGVFDLVTLFEVIEHVPNDGTALWTLRRMLAPGGKILLSTPIANRWVEPHLTEPTFPEPYWHVRAHNHKSMWELIRDVDLNGTLLEGHDSTFVTELHHGFAVSKSKVSFFIPGTPQPFNAFSHLEGFLGGSEEAVIYLSEAMARLGHDVTVYSPTKLKDDGTVVRGHMGVLWRDITEFSPYDDHENVIFWRCPDAANMHWFRNQIQEGACSRPAVDGPSWKSHLWLHDATHGKESSYGAFDKVFVLSRHHEDCLAKLDGWDGMYEVHLPTVMAGNGLDPDMFPALTQEGEAQRDKFKVLYTSSPDRGLERVLRIWPKIRKQEPKATLDIYYDWSTLKKLHPTLHTHLTGMVNDLKDQGVTFIGGVDQPTLHDAMRKAGVWFYPHSGVAETFCISLLKAQACGLRVFTSDAGALPEVQPRNHTMAEGRLDDLDLDIQKANFCVDLMRTDADREAGRKWVLERFTWDGMANIFSNEMKERASD